MAPIRNRPSTQALRPVRAMALVLVIASLLATSCTADEAVTDLEMRCQDVQCYIECPSDSYLSNMMDANGGKMETSNQAGEQGREKRAIAMTNHAHVPIKIIPSAMLFHYYSNNLHPQQQLRLKRDTDLTELIEAGLDYTENDPHLQELCCPKCVCLPCPEAPSCPPNFKPIIDAHEQTGQPGKCCPSYQCALHRMCYSEIKKTYYKDGETWQETACRACRCQAGERRCVEPTCKPLNCEHQIELPDRCCPVCDPTKSIFCEDHNCELRCRNGYERRGDCALCSCATVPSNTTDLSGPDGKTTETTAVVANFTSDAVIEDGVAAKNVTGMHGQPDVDDGFFSNPWKPLFWGAVILLFLLFSYAIYHLVTVECVKKLLFSCNQIPQRKSAYNRVSSTVPVTLPANAPTANSMA
uniref:VWFC domain-containing protein n=2 Tax=Anopheles minimus TaxID=112268 RepID=A0A182WR47_9DIPT